MASTVRTPHTAELRHRTRALWFPMPRRGRWRDCRDLILLQNVMSGPAPGCPAVLRPKLELPLEYAPRPRKLALSIDQSWAAIEPDVRANVHAAAQLFERAGYVVEEVDL